MSCEAREWRHSKWVYYVSIIWSQTIKLLASTNTEYVAYKTEHNVVDWDKKKKKKTIMK